MTHSVEELLAEAEQLSIEERSELAEQLLLTLRTDEERDIASEWVAVAERRATEIENGTAKTVPLDEAIERAYRAVNDVAARAARRG